MAEHDKNDVVDAARHLDENDNVAADAEHANATASQHADILAENALPHEKLCVATTAAATDAANHLRRIQYLQSQTFDTTGGYITADVVEQIIKQIIDAGGSFPSDQ